MQYSIQMQFRHIILSVFIFSSITSIAQSSNSSPYTRYAFGDLFGNSNAYYFGVAGLNIAMQNRNQVNFGNPATYSFIQRYKPIFSVGVKAQFLQLNTETDKQLTNAIGISDFTIGLPIGEKGGFAFGLTPYSTVGYNMIDEATNSHIGDYTYTYTGSGGISKVFVGASRKVFVRSEVADSAKTGELLQHASSLSLGVNANYLFGSYSNVRSVNFTGLTLLDTKVVTSTQVSDFLFDGGLYYHYKFKDKQRLLNRSEVRADSTVRRIYSPKKAVAFDFGLTGSLGSSIDARRDEFIYTFRSTAIAEFIEDTISFVEGSKGSLNLPMSFGAGVAVIYDKVRLGAQIKMQDWSSYSEEFNGVTYNDVLGLSYEGAVGIEYQKTKDGENQSNSAFSLGIYKFGIRYRQTPLQINNTVLSEIGMSFGASIPMGVTRSGSMLNFGVEVGERGTTDNNLIQERFVTLRLGVTIMPGRFDNWFLKRKYN
ncbi:MAG: hypothetical protein JKY54_00540 [Flavobacteriales bacterium]|nr:hypothetical protein [Flavobacteriales bacterium]